MTRITKEQVIKMLLEERDNVISNYLIGNLSDFDFEANMNTITERLEEVDARFQYVEEHYD